MKISYKVQRYVKRGFFSWIHLLVALPSIADLALVKDSCIIAPHLQINQDNYTHRSTLHAHFPSEPAGIVVSWSRFPALHVSLSGGGTTGHMGKHVTSPLFLHTQVIWQPLVSNHWPTWNMLSPIKQAWSTDNDIDKTQLSEFKTYEFNMAGISSLTGRRAFYDFVPSRLTRG